MNMRGLSALRYATGGDVAAAYNRIFERAPDPEGFDYWVNQFAQQEGYDSLADVPTDVLFKSIGYAAAANENVEAGEVEDETANYLKTGMNSSDLLALAKATGSETSPEVKSAVDQIFSFTPHTTPVVSSSGETSTQPATQPTTQTDISTAGTTPATTSEDLINRLLYQPILGRPGDSGGLDFYRGEFLGPGDTTISPAERARFIEGAVGAGELSRKAADAYLGTIPGVPSFLRPDQNSLNPYYLRSAAPKIATNSITGQPQLQGPTGLFATPTTGAAPTAEGMADGGMAKATPADLGSKFDISKFIDEEGRLVGGYSKPIRDEFGVVTGYNYQPYQRDVVFGEKLREREAAALANMSERERAAMMRDLAIRQGRTGVDPYTGAGLPGIVAAMASNRPDYYNYQFAKGGDVSDVAQDLASRGRGGDTMLVHMAPHEVAGLRALAKSQGTELTINPETGMPEALKLGKLFKTLAPFIPFIPGVGAFMAPFLPSGLAAWGAANPLLAKAVASGVIGGFTGPKGGFDLQRGLMQGITAYGMSSLMQNLGPATATPGGTPGGPPTVAPEFGGVNPMAGAENLPVFDPMAGTGATAVPTPVDSGGFQGMADTARVQGITSPMMGAEAPLPTGESFNIGADGEFMVAGEGEIPTPKPSFEMRPVSQRPLPYGQAGVPGLDPSVAAPPPTSTGLSTPQALLTTGLGATSLMDYDKSLAAQLAIEDEEKKNRRAYRDLFASTLGRVPVYGRRITGASGGLAKLAGGGMTYMEAGGTTGPTGAPRDVVGTGDGMSDSVPADIEGVQEARLADGEFVIPADVVSDIGNGSSDAGSDKLYAMMDRIREARHGTTKQPPEINAERMMPA
jgi:hypothetical protein